MSKTNIIGLVVIMALLIGYYVFTAPSQKEIEAARHRSDSIAMIQRADSAAIAAAAIAHQTAADTLSKSAIDSVNNQEAADAGIFAPATTGSNRLFTIENDVIKLKISSRGGYVYSAQLKNYQTYDTLPLILYRGDSTTFGFEFNTEDLKTVNTSRLFFSPVTAMNTGDSLSIGKNDSLQFAIRVYTGGADSAISGNTYIEYVYTLKNGEYMV